MIRLSIEEIIQKIKKEELFHAVSEDYSFTLKIDAYVPYICGAVHDGHQFRKELWENCLHTEYERWYEEDPETKNIVISHPILIAGCDSRFEYDLNRTPEDAVFEPLGANNYGDHLYPKVKKKTHLRNMLIFIK
jgi:hypothetical protein